MTQTSAPKIALNGLGRMGKLALRDLFDRGLGENIVLINDLAGDAEQHALLLEFDSVHGRTRSAVTHGDDATPGSKTCLWPHSTSIW